MPNPSEIERQGQTIAALVEELDRLHQDAKDYERPRGKPFNVAMTQPWYNFRFALSDAWPRISAEVRRLEGEWRLMHDSHNDVVEERDRLRRLVADYEFGLAQEDEAARVCGGDCPRCGGTGRVK